MTPDYAKIVLASRGLTPAQVAEGWGGLGSPGSANRYRSCARNAQSYVTSYSQSLERIARENNGAIPCNSRDLIKVIAELDQEAQAWEALATEAHTLWLDSEADEFEKLFGQILSS
jgi:hypothetical protein